MTPDQDYRLATGKSTVDDRLWLKQEAAFQCRDFVGVEVGRFTIAVLQDKLNAAVESMRRVYSWEPLPKLRVLFDRATRVALVLWEDEEEPQSTPRP